MSQFCNLGESMDFYGTMVETIKLDDTGMMLSIGERVKLVPLEGDKGGWRAYPLNGWSDGRERLLGCGLTIGPHDVDVDEEYPPHFGQTLSCFL